MEDGDAAEASVCMPTASRSRASLTIDAGPFSRAGAASYDNDAHRMPRRYKTAHSRQNDLICSTLERARRPHPLVIDLGCGTANDGRCILSRASDAIYIGVDSSEHMLSIAASKMAALGFAERSLFLNCDFRSLTIDSLRNELLANGLMSPVSCVLSALTLHHYEAAEKATVYELADGLLAQDGIMVVTDLYLNSLPLCNSQALQRELVDIRAAAERTGISPKERRHTTLSERHYLNDNRPQELRVEIASINAAGFPTVDVLFRDAQLAVLAAAK